MHVGLVGLLLSRGVCSAPSLLYSPSFLLTRLSFFGTCVHNCNNQQTLRSHWCRQFNGACVTLLRFLVEFHTTKTWAETRDSLRSPSHFPFLFLWAKWVYPHTVSLEKDSCLLNLRAWCVCLASGQKPIRSTHTHARARYHHLPGSYPPPLHYLLLKLLFFCDPGLFSQFC